MFLNGRNNNRRSSYNIFLYNKVYFFKLYRNLYLIKKIKIY